MDSLPDYAVTFDATGVRLFELTGGAINLLQFENLGGAYATNASTPLREIVIPRATLGLPANGYIQWHALYCSAAGVLSTETIPPDAAINSIGDRRRNGPLSPSSHNEYSLFNEPLLITLEAFDAATAGPGQPVTLTWVTSSEVDNVGFHLHRDMNGERVRLTPALIPAEGNEFDSTAYTYTDATVDPAWTTLPAYYLEDVDLYGVSTFHGPASYTTTGGGATVGDWTLFE
jgi:hypothetical protein